MSRVNTRDKQDDGDFEEVLKQVVASQEEIDEINIKCSEKMLKVLHKYNKLNKPLFKQRSEKIKRVPNFWATSFNNTMECIGILGLEEKDLQRSLKQLEVKEFKKIQSGFRISFLFDENPYFENKVLKKEFHFGDDAVSISTKIKWKKGHNLSQKRTEKPNFFDWFSDNTNPDDDHIADIIKDDLWINPLKYYLKTEDEKEEDNGKEADEDDDDQ